MKSNFIKNILSLFSWCSIALIFCSCDDNGHKLNPTAGLVKLTDGYALGAGARVELWAKDAFFAGYNPVFVALYDSVTGARILNAHLHLHPVMNMQTMSHSCPVADPEATAVNELFPAAIMFTMPSGEMGSWSLEVNIHNPLNDLTGKALFDIMVATTTPSQVLSFQTGAGVRYHLAYCFPEKMKVGVNDLEVIVYQAREGSFVPAEGLVIKLSPEMPSMDHGSPNNEDPTHVEKGHYLGKANFTMTGDWRLNLEFTDENGIPIGTKYFDIVVD